MRSIELQQPPKSTQNESTMFVEYRDIRDWRDARWEILALTEGEGGREKHMRESGEGSWHCQAILMNRD